MASNIKDLVSCSVCTDVFKDPKILPCLHTFCKICLDRFSTSNGTFNAIVCPHCRVNCTDRDVRRDFRMTQFVDAYKAQAFEHEIKDCQVCEKRTATVWCPTCQKLVCGDCERGHSMFTKHDVVTKQQRIDEVRKEKTELLCSAVETVEKFGKKLESLERQKKEQSVHLEQSTKALLETQSVLVESIITMFGKVLHGLKSLVDDEGISCKIEKLRETKQDLEERINFLQNQINSNTLAIDQNEISSFVNYTKSLADVHEAAKHHAIISFTPPDAQDLRPVLIKIEDILEKAFQVPIKPNH